MKNATPSMTCVSSIVLYIAGSLIQSSSWKYLREAARKSPKMICWRSTAGKDLNHETFFDLGADLFQYSNYFTIFIE